MQSKEPTDFSHLQNINYLEQSFSVNEIEFNRIPNSSIVILDDFTFSKANNKQEKSDFLKIINFTLRHRKITLFLLVHNLYNINMASEILLAPHLFLSYSNLGYSIFR